MVRLAQGDFLSQLIMLFQRARKSGSGSDSVFLTTKRFEKPEGPVCLIRATLGKEKISTEVTEDDVAFFERFHNVFLGHSDALPSRRRRRN
ncbi:MAG: hypothetical protein MHM6MM_004892 [Cercozoa sp. M6MM]